MDLHPPTEVLVVWNGLNKPASEGGSCSSQNQFGIPDDVESDSNCTSPLSSAPNSPIHQLSLSDDESVDKVITNSGTENRIAHRPNQTKHIEELYIISRESRKSRIRASRSNWFPTEFEDNTSKPSSGPGCANEALDLPQLSHEPTFTNEQIRNVVTPCKNERNQEPDIPMNSRRTLSNHSSFQRESADEKSTFSGLEPTTASLHSVSDDDSKSSSHQQVVMTSRSMWNQQLIHSKELCRDKDTTSLVQYDAPVDELLRFSFSRFNNDDRFARTQLSRGESFHSTISKSRAPQLPTNVNRADIYDNPKFSFEEDPTITENDIESTILRNTQSTGQTEQGCVNNKRNYQHSLSVCSELSPQPQQLDPSLDEELRNISEIVSDDEFGTEYEGRQPSSNSWHIRRDNWTDVDRTGRNNNYRPGAGDGDISEPPIIHTRFRNNNYKYNINNSRQSISSSEIPEMSLDLSELSSHLNSSKTRYFNNLPSNDVGPEDELKTNTSNSSIDQHLRNFLLNESEFNNHSSDVLPSNKAWIKNSTATSLNNSLDSDPTITFILNESELNLSSTSRHSYNEICSGSVVVLESSRLDGDSSRNLKVESAPKVDTDSTQQASNISDTSGLDVQRNNQFSGSSRLGTGTLEQHEEVLTFSEVERNSGSNLLPRHESPSHQPYESRFDELDHKFPKRNVSACGGNAFNTMTDSQFNDSSRPNDAFTVKSMFDVISGFGNMLLGYESVGDETRDEMHSLPSRNQVFEPVVRPPTKQSRDGNSIDKDGLGSELYIQQSNAIREPITSVPSLLDKSVAEEAQKELIVVPCAEVAGQPVESIENVENVPSKGVAKNDVEGQSSGHAFSRDKNERKLGATRAAYDRKSVYRLEARTNHTGQVFDDVGEPPALRRVRTSLAPEVPFDHSPRLETSSSCSSQDTTTDLTLIRYAQIDVSGEMITEVYEVVQSISPWSDFVTSRDKCNSDITKNTLSKSFLHKSNDPVAQKEPNTEVRSNSLLGELDDMVKDLDKTLNEDSPERSNGNTFRVNDEKSYLHGERNMLNNNKASERATPLLVISIDNDIGIPKGDIMISLLNYDDSSDDRLQKNILWPRKISEAIWRCRKMRRNCDTKWLATSAERNSPRHGQRTSVIVDVDDVRVLGGVDSIADTQAAVIEHLKCDDFDDAIVMYTSILDVYNNFAIENDCTEQSVFQHKKYVATALHNIGIIHMLSGSYQEAFTFFERATMIRASSLGVHHPDHIASLVKMAMCLFSLGDFPNAHASLEMAANLGKDDLENLADLCQFSEMLNNIACLSFMCGEITTAEELFQQCLELLSAISDNAAYIGSKYSCHSVSLNISICKANQALLALGGGNVDSCIKGLESAMKEQILLLRDADPTLTTTIKHLVANRCSFSDDCFICKLMRLDQIAQSVKRHVKKSLNLSETNL